MTRVNYHLNEAMDAFAAVWRHLQQRAEVVDLRHRADAEDAAATGYTSWPPPYREARYELDGALATAEIYAPLPERAREHRGEEAAAVSQRVQTALDNENATWGGIWQLERKHTIRERARLARRRAAEARERQGVTSTPNRNRTRRGREGRGLAD